MVTYEQDLVGFLLTSLGHNPTFIFAGLFESPIKRKDKKNRLGCTFGVISGYRSLTWHADALEVPYLVQAGGLVLTRV